MKWRMRMISLDTETTGVDFHHGARPFFVTMCNEVGDQVYYEWDVDPLTREPIIPEEDLEAIGTFLLRKTTNGLVLQNAKFDIAALASVGITEWPWSLTYDTLIAGHLLASILPHDLTSMAMQYLGVDIKPKEDDLGTAVKAARRLVGSKAFKAQYGEWAVAKENRSDMPSAKATTWKFDFWLPRAVAKHLEYPEDHPWWTVLEDYSNADSEVTVALWIVMERLLKRRGLWNIYLERMKSIPVAYAMEQRGVTVSGSRLRELEVEYEQESDRCGCIMYNIAQGYDYELVLPKSGNNHSLLHFCFGVPNEGNSPLFPNRTHYLNLPIVGRTDTGNPSLDKEALGVYLTTLSEQTKQAAFVRALAAKRKRDTGLSYMESYQRFWLPLGEGEEWFILHPQLNPTGTNTLRWSSQCPNEQNISKQEGFNLRYAFGPAPGREWWSMDAKNIELRIPFYEAGEEEMIALFERPDDPPYYGSNHLLIFHVLHPDKWDAVLKEVGVEQVGLVCKKRYASTWYQWTKNGNFAVQYGAVDRDDGQGTADRAYHLPGAQARIKSRFKKLEALNQRMIRFAEKHGYVETIPDRNVEPARGYPVMCTRTDYGKIKPTVPLSYHVQSTAMWWTMKAMIRCHAQLVEWRRGGFDAYLVMQVHDECVFDLPKRAHPKEDPKSSNLGRVRVLQRLMEQGGDDLGIPTPVGMEFHESNWAEGVTL
jgi:DNA polymerase I-like protein with 3'-5' exonuclease and polymerase domains